jgi:hypothetical protein
MAEPTASHDSLTVDEYLKLEESATVRGEDNIWHRGDLVDEGRFSVPCPETELSLAEVYEGL